MSEKAGPEILAKLGQQLDQAAATLSDVESKTMFGCYALFAKGAVFALVWKEGRIGLRLPDKASYEALLGQPGATPWQAGAMVMAHWVLVPQGLPTKAAKLATWCAAAHAQAMATGGKKTAKKTAKKKVAKAKSKSAPRSSR